MTVRIRTVTVTAYIPDKGTRDSGQRALRIKCLTWPFFCSLPSVSRVLYNLRTEPLMLLLLLLLLLRRQVTLALPPRRHTLPKCSECLFIA